MNKKRINAAIYEYYSPQNEYFVNNSFCRQKTTFFPLRSMYISRIVFDISAFLLYNSSKLIFYLLFPGGIFLINFNSLKQKVQAAFLAAAIISASGCFAQQEQTFQAEQNEQASQTAEAPVSETAEAADTAKTADTSASSEQTQSSSETAEESQVSASAAVLEGEAEIFAETAEKPLTVMYSGTSYSGFSPFTENGEPDTFLRSVTCVKLMETDRSGKVVMNSAKGERSFYNGKSYDYRGLADTVLTYDEEADKSVYSITLRSGVTFSDGVELDADDVIFTLYTLLDPSYDGTSALSDTNISGLTNYLSDSSIADTITPEQIDEALSSDEVTELIKQDIVIPALKEQYDTVLTLYSDSSYDVYTRAYPRPDELFAFFYSLDSEYKPLAGADSSLVISQIADMYGGNYRLLGSMTAGDESYYEKDAMRCAIGWLTRENGGEETVSSVSGIQRTGKYTLTITADGSASELTRLLADTVIAPLHYYGDPELYDYENNSFGFKKGEAKDILSKALDSPLGAGAYKYEKSENGVIYLTANEDYYKGSPIIKEIDLIAQPADADVQLIGDGETDVMFISGSADSLSQIDSINRALERIYVGVSKNNGYGYVGLNAQTVNIAGSPLSEESIMLRRALATAINAFKEESVKAYYGENAEITDRPVFSGVQAGALSEDSPLPYSYDINGEPIFTEDMTDEQKGSALEEVCLGFLEAAGYTVEEGRITEAPEGGRLEFTALVMAGGEGAHPCFYALTKASELLSRIGITLNVRDAAESSVIWESVSSGTHEIWAGSWNDSARVMYLGGRYGVNDEQLVSAVNSADSALTAEELNAAYAECSEIMTNIYAVDIPFYKKDSFTAFSSLRINISTLPQNTTGAYDWTREIEKLEMK